MFDTLWTTRYMLAADELHESTGDEHGDGHGGGHGGGHGDHYTLEGAGFLVYVIAIALVALAFMASAKKGLNNRFFKKPITQYFEQLYVFVENLCVGIIGSHGRKYMPMVMTFWVMIFLSNIVALFFPTSPTADLSFNFGMALIAVGYVQWEGIKQNGFFGHFGHFAGPKMGIGFIVLNLMIFVIEIISEAMKNVSLSLRLYGNIDGGHRAAEAMNQLGSDYLIPVGAFLLPIKLLTVIVQALIFCLLFCVYISLVTHEEHDHDHDHAEGASAEPMVA